MSEHLEGTKAGKKDQDQQAEETQATQYHRLGGGNDTGVKSHTGSCKDAGPEGRCLRRPGKEYWSSAYISNDLAPERAARSAANDKVSCGHDHPSRKDYRVPPDPCASTSKLSVRSLSESALGRDQAFRKTRTRGLGYGLCCGGQMRNSPLQWSSASMYSMPS